MATFSTNEGMRLLVGFTSDSRQLVKAIETFGLLHRERSADGLDKEGGPIRIGRMQLVRQVSETDGFRWFVLSVTPEGVPAGEYTFRLKLRDPATGALREADRPVQVE